MNPEQYVEVTHCLTFIDKFGMYRQEKRSFGGFKEGVFAEARFLCGLNQWTLIDVEPLKV